MFKIYNSKQKARLCCYDRNKKPPSQRKNIGITQPLLIRRSRQEEIKKRIIKFIWKTLLINFITVEDMVVVVPTENKLFLLMIK